MSGEHAPAPRAPVVLRVSSDEIATSPDVLKLIDETRRQADAFVFLGGGASNITDSLKEQLRDALSALAMLANRGIRIAVGDGGTQAGIMEAAGLARRASRRRFPLIGVAPAPEITTSGEEGRTPVDPNHTHVIAVDNPVWTAAMRQQGWTPDQGYWGSETSAMLDVFDRLARGKPSATIVANGGPIVLDEVRGNVTATRPLVLVAGSGRAADAMVASLKGMSPVDEESRTLREQVEAMGLTKRPDLFHVFELNAGPSELARMLERLLASPVL